MTITTEHSPPEGPRFQPGRIGRMTLPNMNAVRWSALVASAVVGAAMALAPPVAATPSRGVESTVIWEKTEGGKDYIFRRLVIAPGGSTGWHSHPGQLAGTFKEGSLIHNLAADCSVDGLYNAGQGITELAGPEQVHIGRNNGPVPVVVEMLYINPAGAPVSLDAPDPGCGFA
jgi:quercetin dioxygenase-like cupin family protein